MINLKKYLKGFTLVELIIVITILAILATIAFVLFQNYTRDARDSNRLTTLKNIESGLQAFQITTGNYPEPENSTIIEASGITINYQGYIGDMISKQIKINTHPLDPFDGTKYTYSVNANKTKYELLTLLENQNQTAYINQTYALDYAQRKPKVAGNNLGILLDSNNNPVQTLSVTGIDLLLANSGTIYKAVFSNTEEGNIIGSGNQILTAITLNNKTLSNLDNSLVGYWDMETLTTDGKLKDLSGYGNHGNISNGLKIGNTTKDSKLNTTVFNGLNNHIEVPYNSKLVMTGSKNISIGTWIYINPTENDNGAIISQPFNRAGQYSEVIGISKNGSKYNVYYHYDLNMPSYSSGNAISSLDAGKWNHIFVERNNLELKFYINGNIVSKIMGNPNGNPSLGNLSLPFTIGTVFPYSLDWEGLDSHAFDGYIDEVRIYNRALSDSEIQNLYNATK